MGIMGRDVKVSVARPYELPELWEDRSCHKALWNSGIPGIMGRDNISLCRSYGKSLLHIAVSLSSLPFGISEFREVWEDITYHCVALMESV